MDIKLFKNDIPADFKLEGDIAIDTESMGLNYNIRDRLCLVQFTNGDGNVYIVQFDGRNYEAPNFRNFLSENRKVIIHFARFDLGIIRRYLGVKITNVFCTKIASKLSRTYTENHGLKELLRELLNVNISKQQQSSDWGIADLSREQMQYAASDVLYLHRLKDILQTMLVREERMDAADHCFKFLPTRVELDLAGFQDLDIFVH